MKTATLLLASLPIVVLAAAAAPQKTYEEVQFNMIKAAPESFSSSKRIVYEAPFFRYSTTFLPYMEKSGFKASKYYLLEIGHVTVPAIARKDKEMNELVAGLRRGTAMKVYGRVKKFRHKPLLTTLPHYYVSVEKLEKSDGVSPATPQESRRPSRLPRRRLPARR